MDDGGFDLEVEGAREGGVYGGGGGRRGRFSGRERGVGGGVGGDGGGDALLLLLDGGFEGVEEGGRGLTGGEAVGEAEVQLGGGGGGLGGLGFDAENLLADVGFDAGEEFDEHVVAALFVFLFGVFLGVAAEAYGLAKGGHGVEVGAPVVVDFAEVEALFEVAEEFSAGFGFHVGALAREAGVVGLGDLVKFGLSFAVLGLDLTPEVHEEGVAVAVAGGLDGEVEGIGEFFLEAFEIPVFGDDAVGAEFVDGGDDGVLEEVEHEVGEFFASQDSAAGVVDGVALFVHDVVVFEEVLAGVEVAAFDAFLGVFDGAGDEGMFNGDAGFHAHAVHEAGDAFDAEDAHEIVVEGEVEAGGTGVTLAASATA